MAGGRYYIHMYVVNRSAVNHELGSVRFDIHVILPKEIRSSVRLGHVHRLRIRRMVRHILELAIYHICMFVRANLARVRDIHNFNSNSNSKLAFAL